jgi:4-nitrophenyl phosphatase
MAGAFETVVRWIDARGIVCDLDGVVYRGDVVIPGAPEMFARCRAAGIPFCFVTNNSTRTAEELAHKLSGMGIPATPEAILTSAFVAGRVMRMRWPLGTPVFVIGAPSLHAEIATAGFTVTDHKPEVVVMGLDREITHRKLSIAVEALLGGAALVGTNPDLLVPTTHGYELGAGAMLAAISAAARVTPTVIGKPEVHLIDAAMIRLGTPRHLTLMVGDQLATDIQAGRRAGLWTVLVRTGISELPDETLAPPHVVVDSLADITF